GVRTAREIEDLPEREHLAGASAYPVRWTPHALSTLGGPSGRIPDARDSRLVQMLDRVTRECPALGNAKGWGVEFGRDLNATDDRGCLGRTGLPVIEGKHLFAFHAEADRAAWRIEPGAAQARFPDRRFDRPRLAYRDVSAVTNRRTLIAAILPAY